MSRTLEIPADLNAAAPAAPAPVDARGDGRLDRGRIPSLDGLRAVAVAMVLAAHACQTRGFPSPGLRPILEHGSIGVEIFFVISGFLITTLMLREIDRTGELDVKAFYF